MHWSQSFKRCKVTWEYPSSDMLKVVLFRITQVPHLPPQKKITIFFTLWNQICKESKVGDLEQTRKKQNSDLVLTIGAGHFHSASQSMRRYLSFGTSQRPFFMKRLPNYFCQKICVDNFFRTQILPWPSATSHQRTKVAKKQPYCNEVLAYFWHFS